MQLKTGFTFYPWATAGRANKDECKAFFYGDNMSKIVKAEFDGQVMQFNSDGWFNATSAADRFGKRPADWLRQRETVEYVVALTMRLDKSKSGFLPQLNEIKDLDSTSSASRSKLLSLLKKTGLVSTKGGSPATGGGTWLHPKLAVVFARWLSVDFAIWCDEQIDGIIHGTPESTDWKRVRHEAAATYKVMSAMLDMKRKLEGKETKPFHYANEAKLVNWAMTGEFKPLDREHLEGEDLDLLANLEELNSLLIGQGFSRDDRKAKLLTAVAGKRKQLA